MAVLGGGVKFCAFTLFQFIIRCFRHWYSDVYTNDTVKKNKYQVHKVSFPKMRIEDLSISENWEINCEPGCPENMAKPTPTFFTFIKAQL